MKNMKSTKRTVQTKKLVLCGVFAALICASTMLLTIPTPTGGYIHCGDALVVLAGLYLGPIAGGISAGIGSMLSDAFLGYFSYVPATFVIKFLAAFCVGLLAHSLKSWRLNSKKRIFSVLLCSTLAAFIVVIGYFFYEWLLTSNAFAAAASGIFSNCIQGLASILISCLIDSFLPKSLSINN